LVEIMVAALVFAIVVVGVVEFFYRGRGQILAVGLRRNGLTLTQQKLEELRELSFSDAALTVGDHGPESIQLSENLMGNRSWSVAWGDDPATPSDQDYKEVMVSVAWSWESADQDTVFLTQRFYP